MRQIKRLFDLHEHRLNLWQEIAGEAEGDPEHSAQLLSQLFAVERFWAYPGWETLYKLSEYLIQEDFHAFGLLCRNVCDALCSQGYRLQQFIPFYTNLSNLDRPQSDLLASRFSREDHHKKVKVYFEVLVVHPNPAEYEMVYRQALANFKTMNDPFLYDILLVDNYQDALLAVLANSDIQACVYLGGFGIESGLMPELLGSYAPFFSDAPATTGAIEFALKGEIQALRPELDHYFVTELPVGEIYYQSFDRVLYGANLFANLHHHILAGVEQRYSTPFFDALRNYATKPKGAFHALPISQGQSIANSHWISDISAFYGDGIFAAETSSTLGGMDSLMDPKGSISQAQNKAARVFQAEKSYYVTNGTTSANKIVMQANLHPHDIVLVSSDCHKSIPYSVFLAGASAIFLETYPLNQYDLYGCVTLERIKEVLLDLRAQGELHRVKQITLTNSTFDGVLYNVKRYMLDILALKPDIIFHWDEAWFSFGYFSPLYRDKTALGVANYLSQCQVDEGYRQFYQKWRKEADLDDPGFLLTQPLYPDPDQFVVRVYATQSIHKTLTAFRQASMLHIHDAHFDSDTFHEAYRTHTSTSPNYQIIASLDFARRQMSLEGYELIKNSIRQAHHLREEITASSLLSRYFKVLGDDELVPEPYRSPHAVGEGMSYPEICHRQRPALFSVDPTRVTLDISATGIDGPNFRQLLMTQYDIQVNKTSRNTILLIINIGVNGDSIRYLLESLTQIASKLLHSIATLSVPGSPVINLPQTRFYHPRFVTIHSRQKDNFQAVNVREAYYAGLVAANVDYVLLSNELMKQIIDDLKLVSASFVTPYPPGFPIIVPGQLITHDILLYLQKIQIKEI
ncbi:MAG: ornithine decarboxylase, partial [Gammaproteobacteria bacterium]|nr:ornithine decarboxylase [Gammaproteobacteria bacterium]